MIPGFPGIMDYPSDFAHNHRATQCELLAAAHAQTAHVQRTNSPKLFFAGVVQTKSHGPGLYEASRLVFYSCWKNRSKEHDFSITQTEVVLISVNPWEVEKPIDSFALTRQASACVVPEGKIGSYGHRSTPALLLGCVPVLTKEMYSFNFFHEVINWSSLALHAPPVSVPRLPSILASAPLEQLRAAAVGMRRRLLWASIYGACHLAPGEGGDADAFDSLMQVLRSPRVHFRRSAVHAAERAPEMLDELYPWLKAHGAPECTQGYQCFDGHRRTCGLPPGMPIVYKPWERLQEKT